MTDRLRHALEQNHLLGKKVRDAARELGFPDPGEDADLGDLVTGSAIAHFLASGAPGLLNAILDRSDGKVPEAIEQKPDIEPLTHDDQAFDISEALEIARQRRTNRSTGDAVPRVEPSDG